MGGGHGDPGSNPAEGGAPARHCSRCQRPAVDSEAFCPSCGQPLGNGVSPVGGAVNNGPIPAMPTVAFASVDPAVLHHPAPVVHVAAAHAQVGPGLPHRGAVGVPPSALPLSPVPPAPSAASSQLGQPQPPLGFSAPPPTARASSEPPIPAVGPSTADAPAHQGAEPAANSTRGSGLASYLVVVAPDGAPGRAFPLVDGTMDLGRGDVTIPLANDPFVCPRHARLRVDHGRYTIQDLGSVNGIYLRLTGPILLQPGDSILVGLQVLCFHPIPSAENGYGDAVSGGTTLLGSPSRPRYARLVETTTEGVPRSVYVLGREETVLGRELGDIVFPSDPFMSRRHAALRRNASDATFTLEDLGSSNGTYLRIRGRADLTRGDHFRIGQHLLRLDVDGGQAQSR